MVCAHRQNRLRQTYQEAETSVTLRSDAPGPAAIVSYGTSRRVGMPATMLDAPARGDRAV
jgi:hypothetical protein